MICCEIQTNESARYQIFQGHVDCTLAANAQNLSCDIGELMSTSANLC